jgi:type II pantothenate kinase
MEQNTTKILLGQTQFKIPSDTIGIDIGQSLTKISYLKDNEIILTIGGTNLKGIVEFLDENKNKFSKFNFTGGKAYKLYKKYSNSISTNLINEFEANIRGIEFLYEYYKKKALPSSLIVTIGTGTSLVLKKDKIEHLGGSAMGGGFFMGLINSLFKESSMDYEEVISLASKGNRFKVDLKVGDIYDIEDDRVDKIFREFTAASFGKISKANDLISIKKEDIINSIIGVIGENLGIIATLMAENHKIKSIVFCGGFLIENKPLKQVLSLLCKFKRKKALFLENSEYSGAIGALIL